MELINGLKIYTEPGMKNRVELSNGSVKVETLNGYVCKAPTFIAKKPWRFPTEEEMKILSASKNDYETYQSIGIFSIPSFLKNKFKNLGLENCKSYGDANRIAESDDYKETVNDAVAYYEQWSLYPNSTVPHNIHVGEPGLANNTFNKRDEYFIGLHLDSWERKPMHERPEARTRICINLGKEPRYLQFYNLQYADIIKMSGVEFGNGKPYIGDFEMLHHFFKQHASYPVVKIKVEPYEAYLAPTENIIHDGCTEGNTYKDINLAMRGYFKLPLKKETTLSRIKQFFLQHN